MHVFCIQSLVRNNNQSKLSPEAWFQKTDTDRKTGVREEVPSHSLVVIH